MACVLSIIIPVYNAGDLLPRCVDSILGQGFADFEVILVDDGSTDRSVDVCLGYTQTDARVKLLRKPNGGASSARNAGLKAATGEYILFVDSDDWIEDHSLERIMAAVDAQGAHDVTFLSAVSVFPDGTTAAKDACDKARFYRRSHEEVLAYLAANDPLPVCVWGKLIRREVLAANSIAFTEGIICEDVDFCIRLYMHAETYNCIDVPYYVYVEQRPGSVMSGGVDRKFDSLRWIIARWADLAKGAYSDKAACITSLLAFQYSMLMGMYGLLPKQKRHAEAKGMHALAWLLGCTRDTRVRALRLAYRLLGLGGACTLLSLRERWKKRRGRLA